MDLSEYGDPECGGYGVEIEEVGLDESTTMGDRDTSGIAGVTMDRRAEERNRDRAADVSDPDDPVAYSLSFDACYRDFYLPRDGVAAVNLVVA